MAVKLDVVCANIETENNGNRKVSRNDFVRKYDGNELEIGR
jgi:hypothetical protein